MEVLEPTPGTSANNESDTNADTCCLGTNFIILSRSTRTADVYSYDTSVEPIHNVPIVTGATAWTDYATINNIADEPAFAWWVPFVRKKRASILSKLKSKYWQRTHKYGIRIPKSVQEAYDIDKAENTTLWRDAIAQEMVKIREALTLHGDDPSDLIGYQEITTHFIFDIKLGENFRRKARLVADGHKTDTPASITYSSVVARDSVRICLLLAALNDLDIQSGDIENAYLTAPCRE
jgi:hypothetical protein